MKFTTEQHPNTKDTAKQQSQSRLPNIIFMMADDMGYGDVQYYGGNARTPNLNAMASGTNSIQLDRHYSGGPACSPTRGTVLTGRNHNRYCIWGVNLGMDCGDHTKPTKMPLPATEITVADILKENGYRTAAFGKWHVGDTTPFPLEMSHPRWPVSHPGVHGFDTWWMTTYIVPTADPNYGCCSCFKRTPCKTDRAHTTCKNYNSVDKNGSLLSWPKPITGDDSHFIYDRFEDFVKESVESGKPLFAYIAFHTLHAPHRATAQFLDPYINEGKSKVEARYLGIITAMDKVVGNIRSLLRKHNIHKNTLLWFTSDNGAPKKGPGSNGALRGYKGQLYEGGIRVPGIIEWPAVIEENRKSSFPVVTSDLLPTACDIIGVKPPTNRPIDGDSILPFLRGETSTRSKSIAWLYYIDKGNYSSQKCHASLMRGDYKLVEHTQDLYSANLYNLSEDKTESSDVKDQHEGLFESMQKELKQWKASVAWSATKEVGCVGYSVFGKDRHCYEVSKPVMCSGINMRN